MNKSFVSAFVVPDKWKILWYELNPFCIKTALYLEAIESPYVTLQAPEPSDTVRFLRICSSKNNDIYMMEKESIFDKLLWIKFLLSRDYHYKVMMAISAYMKEYSRQPRAIIKSESKREIVVKNRSIPDILMLASICMAKVGLSEKEVMTMPICKLSWYGVAAASMEGADVQIISDLEVQEAEDLTTKLDNFVMEQAQKLKESMVNGKIKKRKIIVA